MSSPERAGRVRLARAGRGPCLAVVFAVLALGAVLGACTVEPLYALRDGDGVRARAAGIEIVPVKERVAHVVRNHLIDRFTPDGPPARPEYRLTLAVEQTETALLIQLDDHATRFNLTLRASFSLADRDGNEIYSGTAKSIGSFNVSESGFATVTAERDAADEAARVLSEEIATLVLLHLVP